MNPIFSSFPRLSLIFFRFDLSSAFFTLFFSEIELRNGCTFVSRGCPILVCGRLTSTALLYIMEQECWIKVNLIVSLASLFF